MASAAIAVAAMLATLALAAPRVDAADDLATQQALNDAIRAAKTDEAVRSLEQRCSLFAFGAYLDDRVGETDLARYVLEEGVRGGLPPEIEFANTTKFPTARIGGASLSPLCSGILMRTLTTHPHLFECGRSSPEGWVVDPTQFVEHCVVGPDTNWRGALLGSALAQQWTTVADADSVLGRGAAIGAIGGAAVSPAAAVAAIEAKEFQPWPPPRSSARIVLSPRLVSGMKTLGDLAAHIEERFRQAGYHEFAYFSAPGGFAVVTRLEEFAADGAPVPDDRRWVADLSADTAYPIPRALLFLFQKPPGHYRFFVTIVTTDRRGENASVEPTPELAQRWVVEGQPVLAESIAGAPIATGTIGYVNIYEFRKGQGGPPVMDSACSPDASRQLRASRIALEISE